MFHTLNPFIKNTASLYYDGKIDPKKPKADLNKVRIYGLALSMIMMLSSLATLYFYNTTLGLNTLIIITLITLGIAIISLILARKIRVLSFPMAIIYSISQAVSFSLLSLILKSRFYYVINEGIVTLNPDSVAFVTVAYTIFLDIMITEIFYNMNTVGIRNIYFIYITIFLISLFIMAGATFYFSKVLVGFSFIKNFIFSILSSFLIIFFLISYQEEIIRIVENGTDRTYSWNLALGGIMVIIWFFIDFLKLLGDSTGN